MKNLKGNTPRVAYESGKSCEIDHARTMLRAYLFINKESQHVSKAALKELDADLLAKVLSNPEMAVLLSSLTKTMK